MATIILGVDPGTVVTGYALLKIDTKIKSVLGYGVLEAGKVSSDQLIRLQKIQARVSSIILAFQPTVLAIESPFLGKNPNAAISLGRAQGVIMGEAMRKQIEIFEYTPKVIKKSITGNGNATKEQVQQLLFHQLPELNNDPNKPELLDAYDALAVALCHFYAQSNPIKINQKKGWNSFIQNNPDKVIKR